MSVNAAMLARTAPFRVQRPDRHFGRDFHCGEVFRRLLHAQRGERCDGLVNQITGTEIGAGVGLDRLPLRTLRAKLLIHSCPFDMFALGDNHKTNIYN